MSRLIDAERLKTDIYSYAVVYNEAMEGLFELIDEQPTVDAVEVTRCENCMFFDKNVLPPARLNPKLRYCKLKKDWQLPDDYCSCGKE